MRSLGMAELSQVKICGGRRSTIVFSFVVVVVVVLTKVGIGVNEAIASQNICLITHRAHLSARKTSAECCDAGRSSCTSAAVRSASGTIGCMHTTQKEVERDVLN